MLWLLSVVMLMPAAMPASRPVVSTATAPAEWSGPATFRGWIAYPSSDALIVHAYLFKPEGRGPFKLLVYTPGGGRGGQMMYQIKAMDRLRRFDAFLHAGYAVLAPAYRGAADFGPEYEATFDYAGREVDDVVEGARLLLRRGLADSKHVYFSGVSHGAKISVMVAERYRIATAIAPISGDYDIASAVAGIKVPGYCNALLPPVRVAVIRDSILKEHPGLTDAAIIEEARRRDPLLNVDRIACPVFQIASEHDFVVGHYVAAKMKQALQAHHKTFIDKMYRGAGTEHSMPMLDGEAVAEMWRDLFNFCEGRPVEGTGTIPVAALQPDYPQPQRPQPGRNPSPVSRSRPSPATFER